MRASVFLLIPLLPLLEKGGSLFNQYVFSDWNFIGYVVVAVLVDTATGLYVNSRLGRIHSLKMRSVFDKVQQYTVGLIITHAITSHLVDGSPNQMVHLVVPYLKGTVYLFILACEALSIDENLQRIGKGYLPKWIRTKLLNYKETGQTQPDAREPADESLNQPL